MMPSRLKSFVKLLTATLGLSFIISNSILPKAHAAGESISGFVYEDINGNSTFDSGTESGLNGLSVTLYNSVFANIGSTTTSGGNYTFDENNAPTITSGQSYYVIVVPPALVAYTFSQGDYQTTISALSSGENRVLSNQGIFNKNFFYGRPFYDSNRDGIRQDGETYESNLEVILENSSFVQINGPAAAGAGGYGITGNVIPEGNYYLHVINLPPAYVFTDQNVGEDETRDSDVGSDGRIPITITYGTDYENLDIGLYRANVLVGGKVFGDQNGNGIENGGESGIANIHIDAINRETGSSIAETTTDSDGEYQISFDPPSCAENLSWTSESSIDIPCPVASAGGYYQLNFTTSSTCEFFETEVQLLAANGDQLYIDSCSGGGTLSDGQSYSMLISTPENGTGMAHLIMTNSNPFMDGEVYDITLTYINVSLNFNNLTSEQNFTDSNIGMDDTIDSDVIHPDGDTAPLFAGAGDVLENIDAGIRVSGGGGGGGGDGEECETVCGRFRLHIFTDTNGNGTQDSGEPNSASGTTLTLSLGMMSNSDVPDGDGNIEAQIEPETYTLTINPPSGATITGGSNPITVVITGGELNNLGARGIYLSGSSNGARNGSGGSAIGSGILRTAQGVTLYAPPLPGNTTETIAAMNQPLILNPRKPCLVMGSTSGQKFNDATSTPNLDLVTSVVIKETQSRLIQGYGNGNFGPTQPLTRFELLKVALTSNCIGASTNNPHPNTAFADVPKDNSELSLIVGEAYARGIIKGIDGKFFPNAPVTYAEMLKMLLGSSTYFVDGNPTAPLPITIKGINDQTFTQYIEKAHQLGLFDLPNDRSFDQNAPVNRNLMINTLAPFLKVIQANLAVS
jgi:hypothetical protein